MEQSRRKQNARSTTPCLYACSRCTPHQFPSVPHRLPRCSSSCHSRTATSIRFLKSCDQVFPISADAAPPTRAWSSPTGIVRASDHAMRVHWRCTSPDTANVRPLRCAQSRTRRAHIARPLHVEKAYFREFSSTCSGHGRAYLPFRRGPAFRKSGNRLFSISANGVNRQSQLACCGPQFRRASDPRGKLPSAYVLHCPASNCHEQPVSPMFTPTVGWFL
jgi:hypothetical protein